MRVAIVLLVVANVLLFIAGGMQTAARPPAGDGAQELSPERIRIVSRGEPPVGVPAQAVVPPAAVPEAQVATGCIVWAEVSEVQAGRLAEASEGSGVLLTREVAVPETSRWWVLMPPPDNGQAGLEKKLAELKKLGVRRFSVVEEGVHRNAISFGRFETEADAAKLLESLRSKKVRSAQIAVVGAGDGRLRVIARGPAGSLDALRPALPDVVPAACDAPGAPAGPSSKT